MKRPTFLSVWLTLMTLGAVYSIYIYTVGLTQATSELLPSWALNYLRLVSVINLVAIILLWNWKKIAFYIILLIGFITAAVNGAVLGVFGVLSSIFALAGLGILYFAMKPVWKNFT